MESNESGEALVATPTTAFPFVRRFGDIALIALSSAIPTMPFLAAGRLGSAQRALLGIALEELGRRGLFRVVLIRRPPLASQAGWRRGLRDAKKLTSLLKEKGAELVLHGHNHQQTVLEFKTITGPLLSSGSPQRQTRCQSTIPRRGTTNIGLIKRTMAGFAKWSVTRWPTLILCGNASVESYDMIDDASKRGHRSFTSACDSASGFPTYETKARTSSKHVARLRLDV